MFKLSTATEPAREISDGPGVRRFGEPDQQRGFGARVAHWRSSVHWGRLSHIQFRNWYPPLGTGTPPVTRCGVTVYNFEHWAGWWCVPLSGGRGGSFPIPLKFLEFLGWWEPQAVANLREI